jgi:hypothetical protein
LSVSKMENDQKSSLQGGRGIRSPLGQPSSGKSNLGSVANPSGKSNLGGSGNSLLSKRSESVSPNPGLGAGPREQNSRAGSQYRDIPSEDDVEIVPIMERSLDESSKISGPNNLKSGNNFKARTIPAQMGQRSPFRGFVQSRFGGSAAIPQRKPYSPQNQQAHSNPNANGNMIPNINENVKARDDRMSHGERIERMSHGERIERMSQGERTERMSQGERTDRMSQGGMSQNEPAVDEDESELPGPTIVKEDLTPERPVARPRPKTNFSSNLYLGLDKLTGGRISDLSDLSEEDPAKIRRKQTDNVGPVSVGHGDKKGVKKGSKTSGNKSGSLRGRGATKEAPLETEIELEDSSPPPRASHKTHHMASGSLSDDEDALPYDADGNFDEAALFEQLSKGMMPPEFDNYNDGHDENSKDRAPRGDGDHYDDPAMFENFNDADLNDEGVLIKKKDFAEESENYENKQLSPQEEFNLKKKIIKNPQRLI